LGTRTGVTFITFYSTNITNGVVQVGNKLLQKHQETNDLKLSKKTGKSHGVEVYK
jgi:hypothetical protein